MTLQFEWDDAKARANQRKQGVTFDQARLAFGDPFAIVVLDEREDYGEERFVLVGRTPMALLYVAYTERGDRIRIISARRATRHEQGTYDRQNKKAR